MRPLKKSYNDTKYCDLRNIPCYKREREKPPDSELFSYQMEIYLN